MCKVLINEVMLGKRSVGFECYSSENKEMVGMTAKQVKNAIKAGNKVFGFQLDSSGQLTVDRNFCNNYMVKTGIGSLSPKFESDCIVNIMYTVVGKVGTEYEVVSSRFFHGMMAEEKIKTLHELGAINGIKMDSKGKIQMLCSAVKSSTKEAVNKTEMNPTSPTE
ncbi:MAG: hypothetical protein MR935_03250 [Agathobaculum sp.]|uniref:hypothetical protein n=1 Tax=Agathobaculum sp. TaxID=2048138 RepID=UPI0025C636CD|nr:hypothetical protein [Agathobaculum sp.]MCI7125210.1 hypothetical protein [Agathobaculum sp.]MCI7356172.1 hypothetical protein [Parabacteroides sp.]